jgi:hypothetical protein
MWPISTGSNRHENHSIGGAKTPIEHPPGVRADDALVVEPPPSHDELSEVVGMGPTRRATIVDIAKPIHRCDLARELKELREKLAVAARELNQAVIRPERDTLERMLEGSFLLPRHQHQLHEVREKLIRCMAAVQNRIREADEGPTGWDRRRLERFMTAGKKALSLLDLLDLNAELLAMATRRQSIVDSWQRHKEALAELQASIEACAGQSAEVA